MPDTLNPYNIATEDTAGRLRALGVLSSYDPPPVAVYGMDQIAPQAAPAQTGPQQVGPAAPSWNDYKSANGYDATDSVNRQQLWDTYRNNVIPDIAAAHGEDANTLRSFFDQQYAVDKPKAPTRTMLQAANDTMISAGNAIFGGIKSVSDLVDPSSGVSHWLGDRIKEGHQQYSPVMQDEEKRRDREIADAQARGDSAIMPALSYYVRNPLQGAAEAGGMIAPIAATGGVAGAAGLGARGALAANTLLGGAMGGGQVRGNLFDKITGMSDGDLMAQSPQYAQLRHAGVSEADAKQQLGTAFVSNLPEIGGAAALNAVGARFGPVERALAGAPASVGRAAATALEAGWQAGQGAGTQLASNIAARGALPNQSLSEGVGTAAATGALFGGVTGVALGGSHGGRADAAPADASADAVASAQDAAAPVLALPAPTYRLGGPDAPAAPQGFTVEGSAYNAVPDDVTAALGTLPKVYNRQWATDYLTSALRNGTLEDAARQQNSIGRAAQALLARVQERAKPRQLEAPETLAALPAPDMPDASGATLVDAAGGARQPTYQESADARAARQSALDTGLSPDVRASQDARTRSADAPAAADDGVTLPATEGGQPASDAGAADASSVPSAPTTGATDAGTSAGDARPLVLQNRDRASAGAIGQMNAIAANPDAGRLSFSRDFANGAPVVEANSGVAIPADQLGRQDFSVAADGRRIPVQYAVVDADTLLPSNGADGVPNAGYAQGEPNRMRAIAGNGRVAALQAAYERGTAGGYRTGIGADAALTGISPDVIAKMHNPVLVRVMPREAVTHDIGDVSNTAGTAALSPVEQASTDAQRVNLDALEFTDAGEPTPDSVRAFVQSMPVGERVGLLNPDGSPTRQAIDRLMSATFQRAYGDPELVRLYAQATDPEARTVLGGMASAAGAMARLDGAGDLDVRPLVTDAARLAVNARRSGVKLQDFARQGDIAMTPDARAFVRLFADNARSGKRIGEALQRVADFAHNEVTKPTEDMFGSVERATRAQVLENVNDTARPQDLGVTVGGEPAESGAVQQAADTGRRADDRSAEEVGSAGSGEAAWPGSEPAESLEQRRARVVAEMDRIEAQARERERSGDAEGLPSRTGYSIGDRELVTDWMTAAERDRYHELRTQLPSAGEERQAAAARVQAKVAERRARAESTGADDAPLLTNPTPAELRARDEQQRASAAADADAQRAVDRRAQADEQAKDFRLTGSDRDADRAAAAGQEPLFSRSAQKSVDANIKRGRTAMNRALTERRSVHRAMFRSGLGWVDFVWGDTGRVKPSGKTKGAMGISHIVEARQRKDGLDYAGVVRLLDNVVTTVARGHEWKRESLGNVESLKLQHGATEVLLTKRAGSNAWIVSGYEVHEGNPGATPVGSGTRRPTHSDSTPAQDRMGAGFVAPDSSVPADAGSTDTRATASSWRATGAGSERSIAAPPDADLSRRQAPPSEGLSVSGAAGSHESLGALRDAWEARGLKVDVSERRDGTITLSRIVVPDGERQSGVGSAFMRDLTHYADEHGARIALSPSTDFGATSVGRLRDFYRRHGFVENKGRNRDFEVSESMYRQPGGADLSRGDGVGMVGDDVRRAIADDTFNHNVDVYDTIDDAPDYVREQARREGADDVEGFFDPRTNRVALIAENIASPDRARAVARHELIGHYGIENMVGRAAMRDLATKVSTAERLGNKVFREIGAEVDRTQPGLSADRRAREMIAMMAERNMHNSIVRRVVDGVRQFLNRIGLLHGDTTDAEIAGMLRDAQAYMREQGRPSIADPEAATAFANTRQAEPRNPMFSRAGAVRAPVPMAGHEPTVVERMREMWRNPAPTKDAARTLLSEGASAPQPKWLEDATTALFDYRNPIEQVIRRSGNTAAGRDFRNTMRTFEAATQKTLHDFESSRVDPMLGTLRDAWKSDFEKLPWYKEHGYRQFLQDVGTIGNLVKHGRERNAEIARKTAGKDLAGSGATNEEIAAFEQHFRKSAPGLVEFYEGLYRDHLKPMLDYRDQTLRDAGLLTPEMETGRPKYDWYLPLYGDPGEVDDGGSLPVGGGASLKSPKDKQAMGRSGTLADNPLQNVLTAADSAIRNAGMQQFKKDFVRFVKDAPGAKALMSAKVNEAPNFEIFEKYVDKDGIVKQRVKPNATMSPDAVVLREGDRTTIVHVGNQKVMDALKGANRAQIDGLMGLPLKATRVLSRVYTSWNPMFPLMNKLRDVQSMASLVMADAPTADKLGAVRRMFANNATFMPQWRVKPGSEYHHWLERFEDLGGATQYTDLFNDDIMKNIENEFGKLAGVNAQYKAKAAAQKVGDFVDRVNEHMEMTSRVSLFKALVESGVSERDAALYAKNTMNFETKGKLGQQLGALYTFAGPALFDARRMSQALRTPRGAAMMLAQFALMYGMYGALKAMGGQDDDGVDRLNKVPLSQSGRFLTMIDPSDPDGRGYKFPVGFGFQRIALTLAAATHRYADGADDAGTFLSNVLKDGLLSNFSPVEPTDIDPSKDLSQWAMQQFAPSIAKPLLQLALNQTGQGNPIHKPDEWTGNKLHFQQAWPQTSGLFRGLAKQLYDSAGVDVYPETLQFLLRSYGGGGALDAIKAIDAMGEKADVDKHLSDLPLVRSFGSGPVPQDMTQFRQNSTDIDRLANERKYAEQQGTLDGFDAANPGVEHRADLMRAANAEIKALYKERQEALADEDPAQRQQRALEVNRRIRAVQMRANRAYKEVMANAG
ncbi:GNAT family N-acetyltransferase [Burkholderia sp. Ac-20345]|uniref:LPD38 domain-containing protein n=1 Tax=Burkholderia sp. Ac-20345 TaxID=2703891 RepID=UPI00197BBFED|nr:LPD38 domain-containing protein [Burkholderia sp. Ac-20345]MBN3777451.1 GNAT family N-acetyltransferase [Burkholderia sp. Ac-20345]